MSSLEKKCGFVLPSAESYVPGKHRRRRRREGLLPFH